MQITDEIKKDAADGLTEGQQEDLFYQLLRGQTVKETIETSRGKFTVKFPKQKDMMLVDKRVAIMRGGVSADSYDITGNFNLQKVAFLDVVVESGEAWFNNLKASGSFSWSDMPDQEFVNEVFDKAWTFRQTVQARLRAHEKEPDSKPVEPTGVQQTVGDGVFQGVSSRATR